MPLFQPPVWRAMAGLLTLGLLATGASAQSSDTGSFGPAMDAIKKSRTVRVGYREASLPFSFLDQASRPIGYSLDICAAIVSEIAEEIDEPNLQVTYAKVTSDNRLELVAENKIDLECGSTTANAERARKVAFSPMMFVAGTRLMVIKGAGIADIRDLKGKKIVVTKGTTNEQAIRANDDKLKLGLTILTGEDHEQSYQMLVSRAADAFATDDILLAGLIARHRSQDQMQIVGDLLSYDPYGVMFRKGDPQLAAAVAKAFRDLATGQDLVPLYNKWFLARLPTGEKLGVAMAPQLEDSFKALDAGQAGNN